MKRISFSLIQFDLSPLLVLSVANTSIAYIRVHVAKPHNTAYICPCIPFARNNNFFNNSLFQVLARIPKGLQAVRENVGEVSVVSQWGHQNGAHDIYFIRFRDIVLRVLVWKMDSTFNCYILRVSN
jgi:hypothetical protein